MLLILVIVLLVFSVGGLPQLGLHSAGYAPSGVLGLVLIILVIVLLMGRL